MHTRKFLHGSARVGRAVRAALIEGLRAAVRAIRRAMAAVFPACAHMSRHLLAKLLLPLLPLLLRVAGAPARRRRRAPSRERCADGSPPPGGFHPGIVCAMKQTLIVGYRYDRPATAADRQATRCARAGRQCRQQEGRQAQAAAQCQRRSRRARNARAASCTAAANGWGLQKETLPMDAFLKQALCD